MNERKISIFSFVLSIIILSFFVIKAELNPYSVVIMTKEDGLLENLSALLFGFSAIGFILFAFRSEYLKSRNSLFPYLITIGWILLMFIFMGEEISWGQRLFGIETPDLLVSINTQNETNIHNIEFVNTFMGGKYRYLSIMMLTTGLLLPLIVVFNKGKNIIQTIAFPVVPFCYSLLFIGAYIYGKFYYNILDMDAASEIREFLMSLGMFCFSWHGAVYPNSLFRL